MPRTRSIRRNRKTKKKKSFLPETFQAFIARRIVDLFALAFLASGLFLIASLLTYHSSDPSWNTAISNHDDTANIHNYGGIFGAYLADLFAQTIGLAGLVIAGTLTIWGIRSFKRQSLKPLSFRLVLLAFSAFTGSIAFASFSAPEWLFSGSAGGVIGKLAFEGMHGWASQAYNFSAGLTIASLFGIMSFGSFLYAAAINRDEISLFTHFVKSAAVFSAIQLFNFGIIAKNWIAKYNSDEYAPKRQTPLFKIDFKRPEKLRKAPSISASESSEVPTPPMAAPTQTPTPAPAAPRTAPTIPVVAPKAAPAATQTQQNTQQKFALSDDDWEAPPIDLLQSKPGSEQPQEMNEEALRKNAELLQNVLADYNVEGDIVSIHPGPVVTLYEFEPAPGVKSNRIISLSDDIARSMSAVSVRCAVIPGRNVIGIELPNKNRQIVYMEELLTSSAFEKNKAHLPLVLGKDIGGQPIIADLAKMPHLLVAGTTGSGKSVAVNTMILSLLYKHPPEKCRFIMIDPKMLELSVYDDIPHLLSPVVTEPGKAVVALKWTVQEMEDRYRAMSKLGVRNIEGYNQRLREAKKNGEVITNKVQTGFDPDTGKPTFEDQEMDLTEIPYIVVVVDEFADLMLVAGKDVENAIQRLAQMARAAGIHLIMATQRPSVDVITGVIKANFPTRISFQVTSKVDSRTILGEGGAEQLLGMGDMLYMAPGGRITRVHGPFCSDGDVEEVTNFLRAKGAPNYIESITSGDSLGGSEMMDALFGDGEGGDKVDELYDQAVALVAREGKASTSFVQRYLQIGYNRAARIIEEMERQGVISPATATGKREVLVRDHSDAL